MLTDICQLIKSKVRMQKRWSASHRFSFEEKKNSSSKMISLRADILGMNQFNLIDWRWKMRRSFFYLPFLSALHTDAQWTFVNILSLSLSLIVLCFQLSVTIWTMDHSIQLILPFSNITLSTNRMRIVQGNSLSLSRYNPMREVSGRLKLHGEMHLFYSSALSKTQIKVIIIVVVIISLIMFIIAIFRFR